MYNKEYLNIIYEDLDYWGLLFSNNSSAEITLSNLKFISPKICEKTLKNYKRTYMGILFFDYEGEKHTIELPAFLTTPLFIVNGNDYYFSHFLEFEPGIYFLKRPNEDIEIKLIDDTGKSQNLIIKANLKVIEQTKVKLSFSDELFEEIKEKLIKYFKNNKADFTSLSKNDLSLRFSNKLFEYFVNHRPKKSDLTDLLNINNKKIYTLERFLKKKIIEPALKKTLSGKTLKDLDKNFLENFSSNILKYFETNTAKTESDERKFLGFADRTNPLVELENTRKIYLRKSAKTVKNIPKNWRSLHESHKGKLDCVETPESESIGLTLYLAKNTEIGRNGSILKKTDTKNHSLFGYPTLLIPFLSHNDGARNMMGGKNMKQVVELVNSENPIVESGFEEEIIDYIIDRKKWEQTGFIRENKLALGTNLLVAYLPYKGLNFEDGIVVSKSGAKKLESIHNYTQEISIKKISEFKIEVVKKDKIKKGDILIKDGKNSIKWEKDGDWIILNIIEIPFPEETRILIKAKSKKPLNIGDKLMGRAGNKGVVTAIIPDKEAPSLPDGKPVDMILNPHGVISRMNLSQILETHISWIIKLGKGKLKEKYQKLAKPFKSLNFNYEGLQGDLKKVLLKEFENKTGKKHPVWEKSLSEGKFIIEGLDNPVTCGYQYFVKLNHLSAEKIVSRSYGSHYSRRNSQPMKGRKFEGGQRIGEMEVWALASHGVVDNIKELFKFKSDNVKFQKWLKEKNDSAKKNNSKKIIDFPINMKNIQEESKSFENLQELLKGLSIDLKIDKEGVKTGLMRELEQGNIELRANTVINKKITYCCKTHREKKITLTYFGDDKDISKSLTENNYKEYEKVRDDFKEINLIIENKKIICPENNCNNKILLDSYKPEYSDNGLFAKNSTFIDLKGEYIHPLDEEFYKGINILLELINIDKNKILNLNEKENSKDIRRIEEEIRKNKKNISDKEKEYIKNGSLTINKLPMISARLRDIDIDFFKDVLNGSVSSKSTDKMIRLTEIYRRISVSDKNEKHTIYKLLKEVKDIILDLLNSKEGFPRKYMLGRRSDFSMRAVIVPAPDLPSMDYVYLPRKEFKKMFLNVFAMEWAEDENIDSIIEKNMRKNIPLGIDKILEEFKNGKWKVLLNRQPSLHKYSILSFKVKLWDEHVIGLHPLVCKGFGADFDGDTMAVYIPITKEAQRETDRMLPSKNIISISTGKNNLHFDQDLISGLYYLGYRLNQGGELVDLIPKKLKISSELNLILKDFYKTNDIKNKFEIDKLLSQINKMKEADKFYSELMKIGFYFAEISGLTFSIFDIIDGEYKNISENPDDDTSEAYMELLRNNIEKFNSLSVMAVSGARGATQIVQLGAARGKLGDLVIKSNLKNGLTKDEFFKSAYKTRSSMCDKKLTVADGGELTRILVEGLYDFVITKDDCGTNENERTVLTCLANNVCLKCYTHQFQDRSIKESLNVGHPVGIIAAQAIGERGTQLAMQTFHTGKGGTPPLSFFKSIINFDEMKMENYLNKFKDQYENQKNVEAENIDFIKNKSLLKLLNFFIEYIRETDPGLKKAYKDIETVHFEILYKKMISNDKLLKEKTLEGLKNYKKKIENSFISAITSYGQKEIMKDFYNKYKLSIKDDISTYKSKLILSLMKNGVHDVKN